MRGGMTPKRGRSRVKATQYSMYLYEYTCQGCGKNKSRMFLCAEDFENDILAQNNLCHVCFSENVIDRSVLITDLPIRRWLDDESEDKD